MPEIPDQPKGQDSDDEVLTPVELLLYEHFRYLACPSPVDPVDTDDCASMAAEVIRFLTEKGVIQDQASAYRTGREDEARSQAAAALDVVMSDGGPAEHNPDWKTGYARGFVVGKRAGRGDTVRDQPCDRQWVFPLDAKVDAILPDGMHRYWSTHCRHSNHDACAATELAPGVPRRPSQCKTCHTPCICPCHRDGPGRG